MRIYSYGDIVYYKPTYTQFGYAPMQILVFNHQKNKYLCFVFDMDGTSDTWHLAYCRIEDIGELKEINESERQWLNSDGSPLIPLHLDTRYFKIYDYEGSSQKCIQNDVGKKKISMIYPLAMFN